MESSSLIAPPFQKKKAGITAGLFVQFTYPVLRTSNDGWFTRFATADTLIS
jgi:hypothetical protein